MMFGWRWRYLSIRFFRVVPSSALLRDLAVFSAVTPHPPALVSTSSLVLTPFAPKTRPITMVTVDVCSIFVNVTHKVSKNKNNPPPPFHLML